jgi:hypothetical protein
MIKSIAMLLIPCAVAAVPAVASAQECRTPYASHYREYRGHGERFHGREFRDERGGRGFHGGRRGR